MPSASDGSAGSRTPLFLDMLKERIAVALLLLPVLVWVIADGGWLYAGGVALVLALAAAEFGLMFRRQRLRPALPLLLLGVAALALSRFASGFNHGPAILTGLILLSMVWHLVDYERGAEHSGTDFSITVAGILYLGWIGSYLISLRQLPDGQWWFLLALPSIWLADSAAYLVGRSFGRHRLSPRLSPKKTWEGYIAGVLTGALVGVALSQIWRLEASPSSGITALSGLILGTLVAGLAPLGDLGESMFKREVGVKDSGNLLPGHGGAFDRLDSWIWGGVLGFYIASFLV